MKQSRQNHWIGNDAWRYVSLCFFLFLFFSLPAFSLSRERTLDQFHHTAWTAKDGAPSQIGAIAQTEDGYLWLGSTMGLYSFDGVEFTLYKPPDGVVLPSHGITNLLATPDGGLWIVFRSSGLAFLKNGQIRVFSQPDELPKGEVFCLARDLDGRIWAGTLAGLALFDGSRWIEIGDDWNIPRERIWSMFADRGGTFWVAVGDTIEYLPRGSSLFQSTSVRSVGVPYMTQSPDGRIWKTEWGKSTGTIQLTDEAPSGPNVDIDATQLHFDRDGALWMVGANTEGVKRIRFPENLGPGVLRRDSETFESFTPQKGLSDVSTGNILEDHEGNIWITSNKGLDRFSQRRLVSVILPLTHSKYLLLPGDSGEMWLATNGADPLRRISGDKIVEEGPPMEATSFYREPGGVVWWGSFGGIWRQSNGRFDFFPDPTRSNQWVWEIFPAEDSGALWVRLGDLGLVNFKDGVWTTGKKPIGLPDKGPSSSFQDYRGRVWLGYSSGDVFVIDRGEANRYSREEGLDLGRISVIRGRGEQIWFGGEKGLAVFHDGRFKTVATAGEQLGTISGIVETADGSIWLNELHGIVHIPADERRQFVEDPDHRVIYRVYGILDGMPGGAQMTSSVSAAAEGTDGRIWFATDNGLVWIDPSQHEINSAPPPVVIKSLTTSDRTYHPTNALELPKGTESIQISFTALSLSVPERVHFKYLLEGVDHDWWDAGTRREALITNLGPGDYRFRVIASNSDGVWNNEGAVIEFTILPMFHQTNWFLALCIGILCALAWFAFRWRLQSVKNVMRLQFQERLAERNRIAQDFHDTLLQGFVSASMQLHAVSRELPADSSVKSGLSRVQTLIRKLIEEGRDTVSGLRYEKNGGPLDLEHELFQVRQEVDVHKRVEFRVIVAGAPRPIDRMIADEILFIAREAVVNAFRHSDATMIEIEIEYGARSYRVAVRDDGRGIDSDTLASGREGHWGLKGMHERAKKIGAHLKVLSRAGAGTEILLSVPNRIAFGDQANRLARHLGKLVGGVRRAGTKAK